MYRNHTAAPLDLSKPYDYSSANKIVLIILLDHSITSSNTLFMIANASYTYFHLVLLSVKIIKSSKDIGYVSRLRYIA